MRLGRAPFRSSVPEIAHHRGFRFRPEWDKPRRPSAAEIRASHNRQLLVAPTAPADKREARRRYAKIVAGQLTAANGLKLPAAFEHLFEAAE